MTDTPVATLPGTGINIWLGDGWPGPYLITGERKNGTGFSVAVYGADSISHALTKAVDHFPSLNANPDEGGFVSLSIKPICAVTADGEVIPPIVGPA